MKLWILKALGAVEWDSYRAFVVRALSEKHARAIANAASSSEQVARNVWLLPGKSSCEVLKNAGEPGVVVEDCNAG